MIVSGRSGHKSVPRNDLKNVAKTADAQAIGRRRRSRSSAGGSRNVRIAAKSGASALRQRRHRSSRVVLFHSKSPSSPVARRLNRSRFSLSSNPSVRTSAVRRLPVRPEVSRSSVR